MNEEEKGSMKIESDGAVILEGNAVIVEEKSMSPEEVETMRTQIEEVSQVAGQLYKETSEGETFAVPGVGLVHKSGAQVIREEQLGMAEIDEEMTATDPDVIPVSVHETMVRALRDTAASMEIVIKDLTDQNRDGAAVIKHFAAYRNWILSMAKRFSEVMNSGQGWKEKIAATKRLAKDLSESASRFDIGITRGAETEEEKVSKRAKQRKVLSQVYDMATHSLDPETFEALDKALVQLAVTRKLGWNPKEDCK